MRKSLVPAIVVALTMVFGVRASAGPGVDCSLFLRADSVQVKELVLEGSSQYKVVGHHGPAVENSHMMLRIYFNGSGAIDVYSKTGHRGPELRDYHWYPTEMQQSGEGAGCDEYYVGKTVGLGGIRLWDGEKAVSLNTSGKCIARVGRSGKGAFAELVSYGVPYKGGSVDISIRIDVKEGDRTARIRARELNGRKVQFLTGVNYHKGALVSKGRDYVAVWGTHPANVSDNPVPVGAGICYNVKQFPELVKTETDYRLISVPTKEVVTNVIAASSLENELNVQEKFFSWFIKYD